MRDERRETKDTRGFTFVEVLIVIVIFSIIMLAVYGIFKGGLNVCKRIQNISLAEERIVLALERLGRDLGQIYKCNEEDLKFEGASSEIKFVAFGKVPLGLNQYHYAFDKQKEKLILKYQPVEDALEGKISRIKRELVSLNDLQFTYLSFDRESGEPVESDTWEEEDLPWGVRIDARMVSIVEVSEAGYVYVASGDKKETFEYERAKKQKTKTRVITKRIFLPIVKHIRPVVFGDT